MFSLTGVNFDYDSDNLTDAAKDKLHETIHSLQQQPNISVRIEGHTDNVGSDEYNLSLSKQRANAVRDLLINEGIRARRLTVQGYGENSPVATNDTESGRAQNRRVDFVVTDN
ncbi:MAG: OmpA family protein [Gammaproteobacteria bacterium]|nr:OmpA family protein [Gammaproteobacteria bacterium]